MVSQINGNFNCEVSEFVISNFMDSYNLYNLVKGPTCFKSDNPRCIDLILTNRKLEIYKTKSNIAASFLTEIFIEKNPLYDLRNKSIFTNT